MPYVSESKQLKKQIIQLKDDIEKYSKAISEVDGEEREVLNDHVKHLQTRLLLTEKIRNKLLRTTYMKINGRKS